METSKQITLSQFLATSLFWPNPLSRFSQLCFFWISHLHLLAILFYIQLQAIPSSNPDILVLYLTKLSKIFAFTDVLDPQRSNLGTTIMFTLNWIYFVLILGMIGIIGRRFATNKRLSGNEKLAIFYISQFHLAIGFWISCTFLVGSISISKSLSSPSNSYNPQLMGFYIFLVVLYYIVGIVVSFLSNDPFYSSNILAMRNSYIQVILFISKASILPSIAMEDTGHSGLLWYITITSLLMAVWRYIHLFKIFPYFHSQPMKISVTFACLSILISCANIVKFSVQQSSGTISTVTTVYVQILLGGLLIKLSHSHLNLIIQNAQAKDDVSLKSENEVFQRLFALIHNYQGTPAYIKSQKNNLNELKSIPISAKYLNKKSLEHSTSMYQDFGDINTQYITSPEDNEEVIRKVIFQTLAIAIKRIRHNDNLKIFLAYYALQSKSNLYMATSYLVEASKSRSLNSFLATEIMNVLESIIQERYVSKENETLSIKTFVDFKAKSWRFTQSICSVCKLYLQFWDSYTAPNLEIKELYNLSTKIEKEDETIRNIWTREIEPHPRFASSLVNFYSSYLALVRSASHTSHVLNRKYKSFHAYSDEIAREDAPLSEGNLLSPNNITLKVSLNKANFGKILHVSPNIIDYLGWTQAELTDKNASILLLPSMKIKFNESILKDLETNSTESVWNRNIHLFLKTKEGYAKPAYLYLAIHPYLQEGLSYLAILRVRKPQYEKIVLNGEGMIEGITSNLAEKLNVAIQNPVLIEELVSKNTEEIGNYESGITASTNADKVTSVIPSKTADISREVYQKCGKRWWEGNKKDALVEFRKMRIDSQTARGFDILKYNVSVSTQILFGTCFNILVLKNNISDDSQHADPLPTAKLVQLKTDAKKTTSIPSQIDINKSVESVPNEQDEDVDEGGLAVGTSNRFISIHSNRDLLSPMSNPVSKSALYNKKKTDKTIMVLQPSVEVVSEDFSSREKFENINKEANLDRMKSVKYATADIDTMSTQSVSNTNYSAYIEKIIYDIPEQKGITLLKILSVLCSVICGILLIVFQISNNNNINNIGETTLIASNWTRQLGSLVSLNQWVIRYSLLDAGVYQLNRFSWIGTANIRNSNTYRFSVYVKQIAPVAYSLRESISNLDEKTRRRFFEKIPVYDRDSEGQVASYRSEDLFRIIDQILADMDRIAVTNPLLLHDYTPFVAFITDNTLNEALVYGESVVDTVLNSIQDKLDFMENLIICFAGLAAFLNILLLFFSSSIIRNFADDRKKLMNILLRLDTKQVKEHLVLVSNLCKLLEKGGTTNKKLKDITALDTFYSHLSTAKTSQTYRARPASTIGINKHVLIIAFGAVVLILFHFTGYVLAIYRLNQENNVVQEKINLILDCDMTQYHAILLYYQTFAYIGLNASTRVREIPISQSWNVSYNIVNERLTTFINLAQVNQQSDGNSKIVDILTGNLCKLLVAQGAPAANYCPKGFQGQIQKGLIPVANHVMLTLKNAKSWFDQSARTKSDITSALGTFDMIESEPMSYNYWFPGYGVISDLVRNEYLVNSFSFGKEKFVILWGVFYIILGSLGWWVVAKKYTEHRDSWRKMVRMVPNSMIGNNKLFKAFLSINNVK